MKLDRRFVEKHPNACAKPLRICRSPLRDDNRLERVVDEGRCVVSFSVEIAFGGVEQDGPPGGKLPALGLAVHPLAENGVRVVGNDGKTGNVVFGQRALAFWEKCLGDDALMLARLHRGGSGRCL